MFKRKPCSLDEMGDRQNAVVACACGWHYREYEADSFGPLTLADHLLDQYNAHRAAGAQRGK